MRGASKYDPVAQLDLEGTVVGMIACPHMLEVNKRLFGRRVTNQVRPCGEVAMLVRFPDPYGLRAYCEEGHVEVLSPLSIPGSIVQYKGRTD